MVMFCPYCDIEINEKQIEAEDGCCPECGAFISASTVVNEEDDDYDEYGDDACLDDEDDLGSIDDLDDLGDDFSDDEDI